MGKPAARIGDLTAHGGTIMVGFPTVLIGGMPAARIGDMHVCPLFTPAGPAPIPHVGGPISLGSAGVLIGGMPAARVGDMAVCVGPPDTIAMGCFTVLIGEVGGGGGGGGGAGFGAPASMAAYASAATAISGKKEATTKEEHWVEIQFVDKAGKPVSDVNYKFTDPENKESEGILRLDGTIRRDGIKDGQCKVQLFGVSNAKWAKDKAELGEKVKMSAEVEGFEDGTKATVQIYRRDIKGPDVVINTLETKVSSGKVEEEWEYVYPKENEEEQEETKEMNQFSAPEYYFDIILEPCKTRSGLLTYKDYIEIELKDNDNNAVANEEYILYLSDGEVRKGKLDGNGYKKEEKIPPGQCDIKFPKLLDV